jgi:hypothetical protein
MKMKITTMLLFFCIASAALCLGNQPLETLSKQQNFASGEMALSGPMVILKCDKAKALINSTPDFMYFVPLISPTQVSIETSKDNRQKSGLISCVTKSDSKSFYVCGEFQMQGGGFYKNIFDPAGMIARNTDGLAQDEPLKNILGYIKFEGEGFGWIEITGKIENGKAAATEVKVHFNGRGCSSPVTVGLYSVKPASGEYKYRYNEIVARVDTLTFSESTDRPMMDISISSLYAAGGTNGIWGNIKGAIANLFINPLEIDKLGNDTMLDFSCTLFKGKETFTFPRAKNLKAEAST